MIYILDNDPAKCAQMLDDKSLDRMINDIALVLLDVHIMTNGKSYSKNVSEEVFLRLAIKLSNNLIYSRRVSSDRKKWSQWARLCKANYLYLVELGLRLCDEYRLRHPDETFEQIAYYKPHNREPEIEWARDNRPDLPYGKIDENCRDCNDDDTGSYGNPCDSHAWAIPTPFPLVMPKKHQVGLVYKDNTVTIRSYRKYYKAKLQQRRCSACKGERFITYRDYRDESYYEDYCEECENCKIFFTRREVPDFIKEVL